MKKEHSAVDWSRRPLPEPWLEYAALDVEVLVELREALAGQLVEAGKDEWARQEFEALLSFEATARVEAWRRTSGMHRIRGRRGLGAVRALWEARDQLAERRDVTPGRIIPDSAIVAAAQAMPADRDELLAVKGFHGRGAERYASRWVAALRAVAALDEAELPTRAPRTDGPPLPRAWADRDPVAARRLSLAREALGELAEQQGLPVENVLTPDYLRRVLWTPPATRDPKALAGRGRRRALRARRPGLADRARRPGRHPGHPGGGPAAGPRRPTPTEPTEPRSSPSTSLLGLGDSESSGGRQHGLRSLVDLLGEQVEVGDLDLHELLERLADRGLEVGEVAEQRRDPHVPDAVVEHAGVDGCAAHLEEGVGQRHLGVGGGEVARGRDRAAPTRSR